jgi:hypothetical protein
VKAINRDIGASRRGAGVIGLANRRNMSLRSRCKDARVSYSGSQIVSYLSHMGTKRA